MKYIWNILISIDQFINTLFFGDPDEAISSRIGKRVKDCSFCYYTCLVLHILDKNHCIKSIENDEGKDEVL